MAGRIHPWLAGLVVAVGVPCTQADWNYDVTENWKLTLGADVRLRLTTIAREAAIPDFDASGLEDGSDMAWYRMRERIWGKLDMGDGVSFNARLVNRWHHFFSRIGEDNNPYGGDGGWDPPDETVFDDLNVRMTDLQGLPITVTLGRQSFFFGNGMVFLEGTPADQGRTIYNDGATITWDGECDSVKLFSFYNTRKDEIVPIADRDRVLRRGDIWVSGLYSAHCWNKHLNFDDYYFYTEIDRPNVAGDDNLHTLGGTIYGDITDRVGYSLEFADQFGERADGADYTGMFADARLTLGMPEDSFCNGIMFEFVWFSGDDPNTADEFEGWDPVFAQYPMFREELLPIQNNGNWSNLFMYRVQAGFPIMEGLTLTTVYNYLQADEEDTPLPNLPPGANGGQGDSDYGHLVSAFLDYVYSEQLSFALEGSFFVPGDYFGDDAENGHWVRVQTVYRF